MTQTLASGQKDAAHRRDVYGIVYALTGTLRSVVSGIPNAPFHWATMPIGATGGPVASWSGGWEPYITLPEAIETELPLQPGEVPPLHVINVFVKNLPFRHAESLMTAIADGTWEWEGTEVDLYALYLRRGDDVDTIASTDWISVRSRGMMSGPQDIDTGGFTLPIVSREVVRRQQVDVREIASGDFPYADRREYGKVLSTAYGDPDGWITARWTDAGANGLVTGSVTSGSTNQVTISNRGGFDFTLLSGKQVYLHRQDKVLTISGVDATLPESPVVTFTTVIDFNVPGGALLQQKGSETNSIYYYFDLLNQPADINYLTIDQVAFQTEDGRIVPIPNTAWDRYNIDDTNAKGNFLTPASTPGRTAIRLKDSSQPPALIPRLNLPSDAVNVVQQPEASITQQPDFDTTRTVEATKDNHPTGPGAASAAFDGNDQTGYSVPSSGGGPFNSVTFTFPSVTGTNFTNTDTTRSTLHFIVQGVFQVTDGGSTVFLSATGVSKGEYTIVLGSPENFNQQVRFIEQGSGGIVYEVWWTHELEAAINLNRSQDVAVATSDVVIASAGEAGYDLVPLKAVLAKVRTTFGSGGFERMYPDKVFRDLQMRFLGEAQGASDWYDAATYTAANARYKTEGITLHFLIDRHFTWSELEAELALQSRSYAFYGPNGHALKFIEDAESQEAVTPAAEFSLPGTPNPNASQSPGSPVMERTSLADKINTVSIYYGRDWTLPRSEDAENRFRAFAEASDAESVAIHGNKRLVSGPLIGWAISSAVVDQPTIDYNGPAHALNIVSYLASRYADGHTRFVFDTNGSVVGVERGDIVRVAFAVGPGVYRNVACEVESVKITPMQAHKYTLVCRSLGIPQKGLTRATTWTEVFTADGDTWASRITGTYDRWAQYWSGS